MRQQGHAGGESRGSTGGAAIPFAISPATGVAKDRARRSRSCTATAPTASRASARRRTRWWPVRRGFLTAADAANIYKKGAAAISPALIPSP